jgi:hypothetical protein
MPGVRCRRFTLLLSVALLTGVVAEVSAADVSADEVRKVLSRGSYTAGEEARISAVFEEAESEDVPREMLLPRLAEGVAKRVRADRLIRVLEGRLETLLRARRILSEAGMEVSAPGARGVWNVAALMLWDGAPSAHLDDLARDAEADGEVLRAGLSLYASLADWGLERSAALGVSSAALTSALPPEDFPGVVQILTEARSRRIPTPRAVSRIVEALDEVTSLSGLRERVLY